MYFNIPCKLTLSETANSTITFDANGGYGALSPQTKEDGIPLILSE